MPPDPLAPFLPAVQAWFRHALGAPTSPQAQGWPAIQRGEHTLILAPTGSGKTLAAFLWGLNAIFRELSAELPAPGVRLLYISPLKALNNDIERNLRVPLDGIRAAAQRLGQPLPALRVAVRTGDTPAAARAQMVKQPPHVLITTPESLYLLLTSPRARDMFRTVRAVIVDEIHTLAGNKRGAHLALSLERLEHLATPTPPHPHTPTPIQRIGLSATIRPLEEAARFLGGQAHGPAGLAPRPVTLINAGYRKPLDLQVVTVVDDFQDLPASSIWPAVIPRVLDDIRRHTTTLIFANNRRLAERTADRLNAQLEGEQSEDLPPGSTEILAPGGLARDRGMFALGAEGPFRAHHGSMSREARLQMEEDLKAGRLPALVGTSSLELGIDIGAVDVVVQLQSPKSVAQGLQRVGRSGHLVGQTSKGRLYPTFREDLVESAAIVRGMLDGAVEPTRTPQNPLDVLAQQIVALVSVEDWPVGALYDLVRQAYPYLNLPLSAFHAVLDMLAGRYFFELGEGPGGRAHNSLRPKLAWDRARDVLTALPGSRLLALSNAGTIPATGGYGVYLADGTTRLGELDEEFVLETRVGDAFLLGSNVWRVTEISDDRVLVTGAAGATPRMPFWNGDYPYRPYELGERLGRFRRDVVERLAAAPPAEVEAWLRRDYALDQNSARNLVAYVQRQLAALGVMSSDTTLVLETFRNPVGDDHLALHSPYGGRVNGAWALALLSAFRDRLGVRPEVQTSDDGLLFRFPSLAGGPPIDVVRTLTADLARQRLLAELPGSAVFGARFRMNAGRALLLPRARGRKRTPFWLQRLRAKDLLALVQSSGRDEFPIVAETYRDCLQDVFDLPRLEELLTRIEQGQVRLVHIHTATPSPIAAGLLYNFASTYLYEWDAPKAERQLQTLSLTGDLLAVPGLADDQPDLSDLLRPDAVAEVTRQVARQAPGYQARTLEEFAFLLREIGDLTPAEAQAVIAPPTAPDPPFRTAPHLRSEESPVPSDFPALLASQSRAITFLVQHAGSPLPVGEEAGVREGNSARWLSADLLPAYRAVFANPAALPPLHPEALALLRRYLRWAGPVTLADLQARYPFTVEWLDSALNDLVARREIVRGRFTRPDRLEYCDARLLDQIRRRTLALLRAEVQPVGPAAYAAFLAGWQRLAPAGSAPSPAAVEARAVLEQLRGLALPARLWLDEVLPARLPGFNPARPESLALSGDLTWVAERAAARDPRRARLRFFFRGEGALFLDLPAEAEADLSPDARAVHDFLHAEGASFAAELQAALQLPAPALQAALTDLVLLGLVTNDSLDTLLALLAADTPPPHSQTPTPSNAASTALEAELAARLGDRRGLGPRSLSASRYRSAKQRVARRIQAQLDTRPPAPPSALAAGGRWALVHRAGMLGPALAPEARARRLAELLLDRWGVVARECLERESLPVDWSQLYAVLQSMELRGEVRRGYFVAGLSGAQFALPEAVERLRAAPDASLFLLNAADPANVYGGELTSAGGSPDPDEPAEAPASPAVLRFPRLPTTHLALWRGQLALLIEEGGSTLTLAPEVPPDVARQALHAYLHRPAAPRRVVVTTWNDTPVRGSPGQPLLQALGFHATPGALEWRGALEGA